MEQIKYDPIGIIHTEYVEKEDTPIKTFLISISDIMSRSVDMTKYGLNQESIKVDV